ncbi:protein CrcB [Leptospira fainei serovar Hurstbridge str. BUT 6]|uniref:Fluoride-specific ion channel FluC n=1 Tax=Leptospira fainei serovar Hurstbridge str. BUT 6 TaxID=1193011 RepID=S3W5K6_9LEPT|nr:fluoride efflux transporter CrcB [Leptospira fainei]EPG75497.1 protein CrcB [Leptospira fainei serovar Hurstbridge str. BUT 6]
MFLSYFLVAIGGAVGSVLRYTIQISAIRHGAATFPTGTFIVNIIGSVLIGLIYAISERGNFVSPEARILLASGFCGGFTTFSTFSHESLALLRANQIPLFFLYSFGSFTLCILAAAFGTWLGSLTRHF